MLTPKISKMTFIFTDLRKAACGECSLLEERGGWYTYFSLLFSLCDPRDCSTPGFPVLHCLPELLKLMFIGLMPSNHLILCCLLLFPSIFETSESFPMSWLFTSGGPQLALHIRWPNYWSFNFSVCPSNEYSGLISFGIDCFDLLIVQGTLKSPLQHHS